MNGSCGPSAQGDRRRSRATARCIRSNAARFQPAVSPRRSYFLSGKSSCVADAGRPFDEASQVKGHVEAFVGSIFEYEFGQLTRDVARPKVLSIESYNADRF
jgi:hypothetical protein